MSLSKVSEMCKGCPRAATCNNKRLEACAEIKLEPNFRADSAACLTSSCAAEMLVKHDYRDVKIAPNITVTIDLEDVKKKLKEDLYKNSGLNCFRSVL